MVSLLEIDAGDAISSIDSRLAYLAAQIAASNSRPRPLTRTKDTIATSTGALIIFEACPVDRVWFVRGVTVGGTFITTTAAGNPFIVVSASPQAYQGAVANIPTLDCVDATGATVSLPSTSFYSGDEHLVPLAPREHLVVAIASATSGQQYSARAQFDDYPLT